MRIVLLLLLVGTLAACASPERLVVSEPPPVTDAPVAEPVLRLVPTPEPPAPPPPVEAPRGSIEGRSAYPTPGLVEWRLSNGMTVIYKRLADGVDASAGVASVRGYAPGGFRSLASNPARLTRAVAQVRWGSVRARLVRDRAGSGRDRLRPPRLSWTTWRPSSPARRRVAEVAQPWRDATDGPWDDPGPMLPPDALADLVGEVFDRPEAFTLVVVGEAPDDEAEALVGALLGVIRARRGLFADPQAEPLARLDRPVRRVAQGGSAPVVQQVRVRAEVREAAALDVVAAALAERLGEATVRSRLDPGSGVAEITVESPTDVDLDAVLRVLSPDEVARARRQSLATDGDTTRPAVWLDAVARHYREEGTYRPARPPHEIAGLRRRIGAVSPEAANALLTRLRQSPSRATLLSD